jgi:2,3-bisphosphoglycerate-independent phosphoglycerate mutase
MTSEEKNMKKFFKNKYIKYKNKYNYLKLLGGDNRKFVDVEYIKKCIADLLTNLSNKNPKKTEHVIRLNFHSDKNKPEDAALVNAISAKFIEIFKDKNIQKKKNTGGYFK